jgi:hypothetical protein
VVVISGATAGGLVACIAFVALGCFLRRSPNKKGDWISATLKMFKKGGLREITEIVIEEVLGSGNFGSLLLFLL